VFPESKDLYTVLGRIERTSQFTETQGTSRTYPTDIDDHQDVTMMDDESGQAGGVSDELDGHISLDDSSVYDGFVL
jgi:hypothetical protein